MSRPLDWKVPDSVIIAKLQLLIDRGFTFEGVMLKHPIQGLAEVDTHGRVSYRTEPPTLGLPRTSTLAENGPRVKGRYWLRPR